MKKFVTLIMILVLALAIPVSAVGADFPDVGPGHWAFAEINEMTERGILNGCRDGKIRPEKIVTRAEFAKLLVLASGLDAAPTDTMSFSDVSDKAWYHPYIESAKSYLHGYTQDGQAVFSPDVPARREEVAEALVVLMGYDLSGVDKSQIQAMFSDYDTISGSARIYVAAAVERGLIRGYPDGTFRARGSITRAESVAMLCRAFPMAAQTPHIPVPAIHIATADELSAIGGPQSEGAYYVLDNDIHLPSEWVPIDDFRGTFYGGGHIVSNLFVLESSNRQCAGLFGRTSGIAIIRNVGVILGSQGVTASHPDYVESSAGGLVGYASDGAEIHNCYVTGSGPVSGIGVDNTLDAGGLVGVAFNASVTNCYSTVDVNIAISNIDMMYPYFAAGGLIGRIDGTAVERSSATGFVDVTVATSEYMMEQMAHEEDSFVAATYAGGLVGAATVNPESVEIVNCFATGTVTVSSDSHIYSGGLVGCAGGHTGSISIKLCYATGDVYANNSEHSYAGGFFGGVHLGSESACTIDNSYRLDAQSVFGKHVNESGFALTSPQMQSSHFYYGWDFGNVWGFRQGENDGYPVHKAFPA